TTPGYSGSRPPCGPCQNSSVSIRYCQYCTPTNDPKSRTAGPSGQPTVSVPPCRKRKSAPTKTFRISRRRSSSNTSLTCNCSDCYETKDQQLGDPIVGGERPCQAGISLSAAARPTWRGATTVGRGLPRVDSH